MTRGRFETTEPVNATQQRVNDLGDDLVTLQPTTQNLSSAGVGVLAAQHFDLPIFNPDSKHAASLQRVSNVCADLETERARIVADNHEMARRKVEVQEELSEIEERLRQILERKALLDNDVAACEASERRGARLLAALDVKIDAIGESSLRFEETVRHIAGEARLELERGAPSPATSATNSKATSPSKIQRPVLSIAEAFCVDKGAVKAHVGGVARVAKGPRGSVVTVGIDGRTKLWEAEGRVLDVITGDDFVTCADMEGERCTLESDTTAFQAMIMRILDCPFLTQIGARHRDGSHAGVGARDGGCAPQHRYRTG